MIVNSTVEKKAKVFYKDIAGKGSGDYIVGRIHGFCGLDPMCALALWRAIPEAIIIRDEVKKQALLIAEQFPDSLIAAAVVYIMSSPKECSLQESKIRKLIELFPESWELISDEPELLRF